MQPEKYDQTIQALIRNILKYHRSDAEKTYTYCKELIAEGDRLHDPALSGFGYYYDGESAYFSNNLDKFFASATRALPYLDEAQDWELLAGCYNLFGIWAMNKGNAAIAQDYYLNAMKYCRQYHLTTVWMKLCVNLGVLNNICGRYEDSRTYLEEVLQYLQQHKDDENYHNFVIAAYQNLGTALTMLEEYDKVNAIIADVHTVHWDHLCTEDKLLTCCMEAIYYDRTKDFSRRDICIETVQKSLENNVTIMDMFEDYCLYANMLIHAGKDTEFWHLIHTVEALLNSCSLVRMRLRIADLKLKYYKKHSIQSEFDKEAGIYYELSGQLDSDTKAMMSAAISLRKNLEAVTLEREKIEMQNRALQLRSETDPLTGLANRYRLNSFSDEVFENCLASRKPLAVEILDIDYFKEFNDNYGHQSGDDCLVKVSGVLKEIAEANHAFCARYGGDEFMLIYQGMKKDEVLTAAQGIKKKIMALNLEHKFSKALPIVTVSQGICYNIPSSKNRMWDFLHAADDYLYKVKSVSRNSYCLGDVKESAKPVFEPL